MTVVSLPDLELRYSVHTINFKHSGARNSKHDGIQKFCIVIRTYMYMHNISFAACSQVELESIGLYIYIYIYIYI